MINDCLLQKDWNVSWNMGPILKIYPQAFSIDLLLKVNIPLENICINVKYLHKKMEAYKINSCSSFLFDKGKE